MEQTITIGLVQAIGIVIGIVVGIVGGISTITFALLVYFDKRNEKRIDEVKADLAEHRREFKADLVEHRQEFKADLVEHRREFKADLVEHRQEFKADLVEHRQEFKADLQEVKADLQEVQRNERTLTSKVDRIQGTLDVLVFGERVPEPVAREREPVETAGD